ncbi:MAG TPA: glycosyltransferase [Polyangiaceae bacterium]|nr:glycosyltransferase [Polyangiaceae bacterium]
MRALIVSYAFPPVGGAGVQRVLKLVKYLPACGVTPTVLTAGRPSVPIFDASLEREVPAGTQVMRAMTLEPGYAAKQQVWESGKPSSSGLLAQIKRSTMSAARHLLVPDPQVLWLPAAQGALTTRLWPHRDCDVVLISGPPFSQFLLAPLIRCRPRVGLVLDYRDEWTTTSSAYEMSSSPRISALMEQAVLRCAHVITTATEQFRLALLERFSWLDPEQVVAIPNGYDPEDFPPDLPAPPTDRFVLSYAGTVFRLTSARGLIAAVRLLHEREPELAKLLEVRFIGRIVETETSYFEGSESLGVRRLGYLEHAEAIEQLAASHAVLCILDDVAGVERIYPAKIFEIMQLKRYCFALTPEGSLADLVRAHQLGEVIAPRDIESIANRLAHALREFRMGTRLEPAPTDIERFDRRRQAEQFAALFRGIVASRRSSHEVSAAPAD